MRLTVRESWTFSLTKQNDASDDGIICSYCVLYYITITRPCCCHIIVLQESDHEFVCVCVYIYIYIYIYSRNRTLHQLMLAYSPGTAAVNEKQRFVSSNGVFRRANCPPDMSPNSFGLSTRLNTSRVVRRIMQIPLSVKCLGLHRMCIEQGNMLLMVHLSLCEDTIKDVVTAESQSVMFTNNYTRMQINAKFRYNLFCIFRHSEMIGQLTQLNKFVDWPIAVVNIGH